MKPEMEMILCITPANIYKISKTHSPFRLLRFDGGEDQRGQTTSKYTTQS